MASLDDELKRTIATGKVSLGTRSVLREIGLGRAKIVILSSNIEPSQKERILKLAEDSSVPVLEHRKPGIDLGNLCGKPFSVSAISVRDTGDSKITSLAGSRNAQ